MCGFPLQVVHGVIGALKDDISSLKQCSQVARSWHSESRQWIFEAIVINSLEFRFDLVHARFPNLLPGARDDEMAVLAFTHTRKWTAGCYARTLRLVQCPWMWMQPRLLTHFSHHFSVFINVTSLTIDTLDIYLFSQVELRVVFGHFFRTVTELALESPRSDPHDLVAFLRHFSGLENLTISDPEWVEVRQFLFHPRKASPLCKGRLDLIGLGRDSSPFVRLLSRLPLGFRQLSIIGCSLEGSEFDPLLDRLGESLRSLAVSTWFRGTCLTWEDLEIP